jgi:DNA-binding NtrC family response regulator
MLRLPKAIILSADPNETAAFEEMLSEYADLKPVATLHELPSVLDDDVYDAIFCAKSFQASTWKDALEDVRESHPDLPFIVLASAPEEKAWVEAIDAGAFDLLVPPYEERQVLAVLEQAFASRDAGEYNQYPAAARARA